MLVTVEFGFFVFKDHLGIFPGVEAIADYAPELADFKTSKGAIQFTVEQPIPDDLFRQIVGHRLSAIS